MPTYETLFFFLDSGQHFSIRLYFGYHHMLKTRIIMYWTLSSWVTLAEERISVTLTNRFGSLLWTSLIVFDCYFLWLLFICNILLIFNYCFHPLGVFSYLPCLILFSQPALIDLNLINLCANCLLQGQWRCFVQRGLWECVPPGVLCSPAGRCCCWRVSSQKVSLIRAFMV